MTERRLNKSGSTSYTISLPIDWVRFNNLSSKDVLNVYAEGETLRITCKPQASKAKIGAPIDAHRFTKRTLIERIRRQYHSETGELVFKYQNTKDIETIATVMDRFAGFEIHSQDDERIVYKYLFDPELIGEQQILRKMDLMIRTIVRELVETLDDRGFHPDVAAPRRQIENLRKQAMLLERHMFRLKHLTVERMNVFLAGRSLLKMGLLLSDFFAALAVLDEHQVTDVVSPLMAQFHALYCDVMKAFIEGREEPLIGLKEKILEQIDLVENDTLSADTVLLALCLSAIKNLLHEAVRITELSALAKES